MIKEAAVRYLGVVYTVPRPERHDAALKKLREAVEKPDWGTEDQGFITDTGDFVDRLEAAKIAIKCGQIEYLKWPPQLYSEDLW